MISMWGDVSKAKEYAIAYQTWLDLKMPWPSPDPDAYGLNADDASNVRRFIWLSRLGKRGSP